MTKLYNRACEVVVSAPPAAGQFGATLDAFRIASFRTSFTVSRSDKPEPNPAEVTIYNLSKETRARFTGKGWRIALLAGYGDQLAQVFAGDVRDFVSEDPETESVLKIRAGDGERAFNFARVGRSYPPGTPVIDAVQHVLERMGIDPGTSLQRVATALGGKAFGAGYAHQTRASTELSRLLDPLGLRWSIQGGRLEVLGEDEALPELAPLVSPLTGLIGSPELGAPEKKGKKPLLKVKMLLQPRLRPGQRFQLQSESHNGLFRCKKVTHRGDTHGSDWISEVEAQPAT